MTLHVEISKLLLISTTYYIYFFSAVSVAISRSTYYITKCCKCFPVILTPPSPHIARSLFCSRVVLFILRGRVQQHNSRGDRTRQPVVDSMAKSFSTEFRAVLSDQIGQPSDAPYRLFHGFFWRVSAKRFPSGYISLYLACEPVNSSAEWRCSVEFSWKELNGEEQRNSHTFSSSHSQRMGMIKFRPDEGEAEITIEACITIEDVYMDRPILGSLEAVSNRVITFHHRLPLLDPDSTDPFSVTFIQEAKGQTIVARVNSNATGLAFRVDSYNIESGLMEDKSGIVVVVVKEDTIARTIAGNIGDSICLDFPKKTWPGKLLTIMVDDFNSGEGLTRKGLDFGREYLDVPPPGHVTFRLKDKTVIPLNPYILAQNSPVLKNLIEEDGTLEYELISYQSESVRIFIDACYSGTIEKLYSTRDLHVIEDFFTMVVELLNVPWATEQCLNFFKEGLPKSLKTDGYWHFAFMALDLSVIHGNHSFLVHLFSSIPEKKEALMFKFSYLLTETENFLQVELVMALAVEFDLVPDFVNQLHSAIILSEKATIIVHVLENFNFSICDDQDLKLLSESLKEKWPCECFKEALESEKNVNENTDQIEGDLIPKDGTLATLARNHWRKITGSTWPCSKARPFSVTKRDLFKEAHPSSSGEVTKENDNNPKRRRTRSLN